MVIDGYRQFAVRHEAGELVAVAGAAVHVNLYYGRHLYDLVVTEGASSKGYGELLLDHLEGIARREGCETAALACDLEREGAPLRAQGLSEAQLCDEHGVALREWWRSSVAKNRLEYREQG